MLTSTTQEQLLLSQQPAEYRAHLVEQCAFTLKSDIRKLNAWKRWQIYTEQHAPLVLECIISTQNDPNVRKELEKFVDLTVNPGLDITRQTAVCWRQGARRSIEGASEEQLAAFHELVLESKIDTHAPAWNRVAEFVGPVIVAPAVRKGILRWDTLLGTYTDVQTDPDDRHGTPLAAAWTVRAESERPADATVCVLDDKAWTTYTATLGPVLDDGTRGPPEIREVAPKVTHDLGYFPGVPLRFDSIIDGDWWGSPFLNQRLVDATVRLGTLNAILAYTRKSQNKKLLKIVGDLGGFPDGQVLEPEVPLVADIPANGQGTAPAIEALDFDTDPGKFIRHAEWIYRNIASAYGGQIESDASGSTSRIVFSTEALTEIRNEQIPHARMFERDLWANAVDMCRKFGHRLASSLPTREQVLAGFRIDFGKLSRKFSEPKAEQDWTDHLLSKGATDQLEIVRAQGNATLDDSQLKDLIARHLENQSWFNNILATRNLSLIDGKVRGTAEANGATGPAIRDGKPIVIAGAQPGPQGADGFAALPGDETTVDVDAPPPVPDDGAAPKPGVSGKPAEDVQAQALNGAQFSSFLELANHLALGQLPIELGERFLLVAFPGAVPDEAAAQRLLAPLRGFTPRAQPNESSTADAGADAPKDDDAERTGFDERDGQPDPD